MVINTNTSAQSSARLLSESTSMLNKSLARLSSGFPARALRPAKTWRSCIAMAGGPWSPGWRMRSGPLRACGRPSRVSLPAGLS